jgi:hypothetical protein
VFLLVGGGSHPPGSSRFPGDRAPQNTADAVRGGWTDPILQGDAPALIGDGRITDEAAAEGGSERGRQSQDESAGGGSAAVPHWDPIRFGSQARTFLGIRQSTNLIDEEVGVSLVGDQCTSGSQKTEKKNSNFTTMLALPLNLENTKKNFVLWCFCGLANT